MMHDSYVSEVVLMRDSLLRAARVRLRNSDWAEDAVSATMLAALERRPAFDEPARVRAWLFGVLRHKVVDQLRNNLGDGTITSVGDRDDLEAIQMPDANAGRDPVHRAGNSQFVLAQAQALEQLPSAQARAIALTVVWGSSTQEVCAELRVSASNLGVMLHRARTRLREDLRVHHR